MVIDWSILCCRRIVDLGVDSGYSTEPTRYFQFLPLEHLPDARRPEWIKHFDFPPFFPTPLLSTKLRSVGKRTLVLKPRNQPYMRPPCNVTAAMGTTISQDHSVAIQPTQASTYPFFLCRRCREMSPAMDRRCLAHTSPHFSVPLLRWPCCFPLQRQCHDL